MTNRSHPTSLHSVRCLKWAELSAMAVAIAVVGQGCASQQATFETPELAVRIFVAALDPIDRKAMAKVLGPDAKDLINTGDPTLDEVRVSKFLEAYRHKNALVPADDGSLELVVGEQEWPMPIPLAKDGRDGTWRFDTAAGREEVLNRRIGLNELDAIEVCRALFDAQMEYATLDPDGDGIGEYARLLVSSPGKRDGLYWPDQPGQMQSPAGELVAEAVEQGYGNRRSGQPRPYHGYYFKLLTAQGPSAPGGTMDYIFNGRMIGGFAIIAYPAIYGNPGIKTFMISHHGQLYEKNLGPRTASTVRGIRTFDPGDGWKLVPATP